MLLNSRKKNDVEGRVSSEEETIPFLLNREIVIKEKIEFEHDYHIGELLGSGKFGDVLRCTELKTNYELAAKVIPVKSIEEKQLVMNEVAIMSKLRHARLIQLYDVYIAEPKITLVMELITGGELFERVIDDTFELDEAKCAKFMTQILQGVEYIHRQHVVHLDLKPENILCLSRTGFSIKIIDFGLAHIVDDNEIRVLFGTPEFVAPEVIAYDPVTYAADMWSVGVICYVLLSGLSPFVGENEGETLSNVTRCVYSFDYEEFNQISKDAKSFIKKLLVKDPRKRYSASKCLNHRWLNQEKRKKKKVAAVNTRNLKHFVYRRKWQKAINAIIALQRMGVCLTQPSEILDARKFLQTRTPLSSSLVRRCSLQSKIPPTGTAQRRASLFTKLKPSYLTLEKPDPKTRHNNVVSQLPPVRDERRRRRSSELSKMLDCFSTHSHTDTNVVVMVDKNSTPPKEKKCHERNFKMPENESKKCTTKEIQAVEVCRKEILAQSATEKCRSMSHNEGISIPKSNTLRTRSQAIETRINFFSSIDKEHTRKKTGR